MLGVTKTGPGTVELTERPEPVVRAGHVVLDVVGAGICGTDLHIWDDEFPSEPPVTMGHEVSGVVREVGEGVAGWAVGDRVVSETYFSTCGECEWCRGGRLNLCAQRRSIGSREDGAFAARVLVPARGIHRIPDWLDGHAASHRALLGHLSGRLRAYYRGKLARIGRGAIEAEDLVQEAILAIHLHP